ncbi:magnesium transporter CorA family protein [Fundicoccus sp. Sow4_H7]|uniref:magnesium transporter CorA family protein n=1 Tax=Fundicoccus sp. Sow4_H7 TaxID=3438784 RepID=UPI003F908934
MIKTIQPTNNQSYQWIQLEDASVDEINQLVNEFDLPHDFITSSLDTNEISRLEEHLNKNGDHFTLLVINYPYVQENEDIRQRYQTQAISIVYNHETLITSFQSSFTDIYSYLIDDSKKVTFDSPELIMLEILRLIARSYLLFIEDLEEIIMDLEMTVVHRTENELFFQLMGINRGLVNFQVAIEQNQQVIESLHKVVKADDNNADIYSKIHDVLIEQKQAKATINRLRQYNDKISDILSNVVNNNLNNIMKVLTVWSIILTIPTIISGIWGMNVPLPGTENNMSHTLLIVGSGLLMLIVYMLFKKNKWI